MYLIQDENGQVELAHSISAGLDYPGIGPEHSYYHDIGRVQYKHATDTEAMEALIRPAKWKESYLPLKVHMHLVMLKS